MSYIYRYYYYHCTDVFCCQGRGYTRLLHHVYKKEYFFLLSFVVWGMVTLSYTELLRPDTIETNSSWALTYIHENFQWPKYEQVYLGLWFSHSLLHRSLSIIFIGRVALAKRSRVRVKVTGHGQISGGQRLILGAQLF